MASQVDADNFSTIAKSFGWISYQFVQPCIDRDWLLSSSTRRKTNNAHRLNKIILCCFLHLMDLSGYFFPSIFPLSNQINAIRSISSPSVGCSLISPPCILFSCNLIDNNVNSSIDSKPFRQILWTKIIFSSQIFFIRLPLPQLLLHFCRISFRWLIQFSLLRSTPAIAVDNFCQIWDLCDAQLKNMKSNAK